MKCFICNKEMFPSESIVAYGPYGEPSDKISHKLCFDGGAPENYSWYLVPSIKLATKKEGITLGKAIDELKNTKYEVKVNGLTAEQWEKKERSSCCNTDMIECIFGDCENAPEAHLICNHCGK